VARQTVGDACREARFPEPAHAVDQYSGVVTSAVLLVPKDTQDLLSLTPAADEAARRGDRHFLVLVEKLLEADRFLQPPHWLTSRAHRPATVSAQIDPGQVPVPAQFLFRIAHQAM
jgi:hypothetical protein